MARRKIRAVLLISFGITAGLGVRLEASSRSETYRYDASGQLTKRVVAQPGRQDKVTLPEEYSSDPRANGGGH